jgi:RsiW-degrading membrane proteinase PrsW (M82 family)
MTLPAIPVLLTVLLCAALFVLLFQYLFPRPAPWRLAAAALGAGVLATLVLSYILHRFVAPGLAGLEGLNSVAAALPFAFLRAGLPEEATKALAALIALLPFWRRVTPAAAFRAALFVAVGFAIVENQGYASAFNEFALLIAFGRGFMATLTHTLLAMIFGGFLMRFAARGWRHWHLLVVGYLVAVLCHSLYDAGLIPILVEYMRTKTVDEQTVVSAAPVVVGGILLVLIAGLWSLRTAIRRAAADDDAMTAEPQHQVVVRRWRSSANTLLVLGFLGLAGAITWTMSVAASQQHTTPPDDLQHGLPVAIALGSGVFAIILSWVLRQKR